MRDFEAGKPYAVDGVNDMIETNARHRGQTRHRRYEHHEDDSKTHHDPPVLKVISACAADVAAPSIPTQTSGSPSSEGITRISAPSPYQKSAEEVIELRMQEKLREMMEKAEQYCGGIIKRCQGSLELLEANLEQRIAHVESREATLKQQEENLEQLVSRSAHAQEGFE